LQWNDMQQIKVRDIPNYVGGNWQSQFAQEVW